MAKPLKETSKKRLFADKIEEAATVDAKPLGREPNKGDASDGETAIFCIRGSDIGQTRFVSRKL